MGPPEQEMQADVITGVPSSLALATIHRIKRSTKFHRKQRAAQKRAHKKAQKAKRRRASPVLKNRTALPGLKPRAATVVCPEILDFDRDGNGTVEFFHHLDRALLGITFQVVVDHRPLVNLSPAAALVLIAHMYRAQRRNKDLTLLVHLPPPGDARDLLGMIGYYDYCQSVNWVAPRSSTRFYLAHKTGVNVKTDLATELCEHFQSGPKINIPKLYVALIEGMGNACEWGYEKRTHGYRNWWLLGYRDGNTNEIAYSFYDQGVGIPVSIRTRFADWFPLFRPRGSDLIEKAVTEGRYSRTKQKGRGTGLPSLLDFVEQGSDGELLILSNESRCIFHHGKSPTKDDFTIGLRGTLISWSFKP